MKLLEKKALSRRLLLKGAGVSALGAGLGVSFTQAQSETSGDVIASQNFALGDMQVTALKEASLELQPSMFGGGAPEGAVSELLGEYNLPTDVISATANVMLLDNSGELTLVDTGTGANLVTALNTMGASPQDIGTVILTHWHGDHVGGVSAEGTLNFPNATHYFPQADWDFLQGATDNQGAQDALSKVQPAQDAGMLEFYSGDQELVSGITTVAAPGHTPGHHALEITSGDKTMLHMADTANHFLVSLMHPEWSFSFDANPEQATETRRQLYGRAADEGTQIFAYHFPFPGIGYVASEGEGFRFLGYV